LKVTAALVIKLVVTVGLELAHVPLAAALFLAEGLGAIRLVGHLRLKGEVVATVGSALQSIEGLENIALRGESRNCVHASFGLWSCKSDF